MKQNVAKEKEKKQAIKALAQIEAIILFSNLSIHIWLEASRSFIFSIID